MASLSNRLFASSRSATAMKASSLTLAASRGGPLPAVLASGTVAAAAAPSQHHHCYQQRRLLARGEGGSRGSRGHGWYVKYRSGRGGRHLQGEYWDRESPEEMAAWNQSILDLGSQRCYMDVVLEPRRANAQSITTPLAKKLIQPPALESLTGEKLRLEMDIATAVMPETTRNFLELLDAPQGEGYLGTRLYRVEKKVGIYGGDMLTNTGKVGKALRGNPMQLDIANDPLALWHLPGTITMIVQNVGAVDSRFMMMGHASPHVDGIARAFGQLTPESTQIVTRWVDTLMTRVGIPTMFDLVVASCGVLDASQSTTTTTTLPDGGSGKAEAAAA